MQLIVVTIRPPVAIPIPAAVVARASELFHAAIPRAGPVQHFSVQAGEHDLRIGFFCLPTHTDAVSAVRQLCRDVLATDPLLRDWQVMVPDAPNEKPTHE